MSDRPATPERGRPERVRITHPRTTAARPLPVRPPAREIDELTQLGELYLASLLRAQRRTAFGACAAAIGGLVALAVTTAEHTGWSRLTVAGIALPWVLVGAAVYPVLGVVGWLAVRRAERNEREFAALMHQR
jgi:hypothetical protein